MALTLDPDTRIFTILQADLTPVSGVLYELDTEALRLEIIDLLDDEAYVWLPDALNHNTEVALAGVTYARLIEMINGFSIEFEFTGAAYAVRFVGSNNNFFDVANGILVPTALVSYISTNSAGLQTVVSGSGVTQQDKDDIENQIFARLVEGTFSFESFIRLIAAEAAGKVNQLGDGSYAIRDVSDTKDRIEGDAAANSGRDITAVDGS